MRLADLADKIGATVHCVGNGARADVDQVYAGDRISDLLGAAGDHTLLVSNLASTHLIRVAELMDIPGICLVGGQKPDETMLAAARAHGTLLMVSPFALFETCGRLYRCLTEGSGDPHS
jgi:hypothetical protein